MKKIINNWDQATNQLATAFVKKYYGKEFVGEYYWAADTVGDVLFINDDVYCLSRMKEALELRATYDQLQEYFDYEVWTRGKPGVPEISFKNYLNWGAIWKK